MRNIRLAYLASGGGTSVDTLASKIEREVLEGFESTIILTNKEKGEAGIYDVANRHGIPIWQHNHFGLGEIEINLLRFLEVDLILGLGYIKKVSEDFLDSFEDRVINIHPAPLPDFGGKGMYGLAPHRAVLEAQTNMDEGDNREGHRGMSWSTVHLMNSVYDDGRSLAQRSIIIPNSINPTYTNRKVTDKDAQRLQQLMIQTEYALMEDVLRKIRNNDIKTGLDISKL